MPYCMKCGTETGNIGLCNNCQNISDSNTVVLESDSNYQQSSNNDYFGLSSYYQNEFTKIQLSNEMYTGKWNWSAFLFGSIWALSKGLWLSFLIAIISSMLTYGVTGIIYTFIFAVRGNYMYYNFIKNKKQLPF